VVLLLLFVVYILGVDQLGDVPVKLSVAPTVFQDCSTISLTFLQYSLLFSWYRRAASEFAGEFGFGSHNKDCIEVRIAAMS